jgi:antitoxin (DNA-binding transcriptional repressor) of toxin-antitoxin stability system
MQTISTRDLAHRAKDLRRLLAAGQPLQWATRGKIIARLEPPARSGPKAKPDWIARATKVGAINRRTRTVSQELYDDRS